MMENYSYGDELLDLIQTHADIFSPFFCFDSPGFAEKVAMLARWGLGSGLPPDAPVGRVPAHVSGPSPAPSRSREHMPRLAAHVALRTVGDETFVLDTRDCILHRPGLRAGGLLHACQRGDTTEDYVALVSGTTGTGTEDVAAYVRRSLAELAKRGFLEAD
jgi:hypothetical protein